MATRKPFILFAYDAYGRFVFRKRFESFDKAVDAARDWLAEGPQGTYGAERAAHISRPDGSSANVRMSMVIG